MKEIFINNDKLKDEEMDEDVTRVKSLLINDKNEILLGYSHNTYQFIGGHVEKEESLENALIREIEEESGIKLDHVDSKPFALIKYYSKNYHNSGKNRCNKIYYYAVNTNAKPKLNNTHYTTCEKDGNFELRYVNLSDVKRVLVDNNKISKYKDIAYEMLRILDIYLGQ